MESVDVVIVGGGPAGIGAARQLAVRNIKRVVVVEREAEAGGIPRHCGHRGFGWQSHFRIWTGPRFAEQLRREAAGLDVRINTTVSAVQSDGRLTIRNSSGMRELKAMRILIATGTRESSRAFRMIGGARPSGVMNTGALQQHVYVHGHRPFRRPVIIGQEWVSYSAILTCRHLGIEPVALISARGDERIPAPLAALARVFFGVPAWPSVTSIEIDGRREVENVSFIDNGVRKHIACDGVIISGRFVPENQLVAASPIVFTAGNAEAPLKTSGRCWLSGRAMANKIADSLP